MTSILGNGTAVAHGTYFYAVTDVAGLVGTNNILAVFNPSTTTTMHVGLLLNQATYSIGSSTTATSLQYLRISSISGGTLIAASAVPRFMVTAPDPQTQVYINNPTVTLTGNPFASLPPPITTGVGGGVSQTTAAISGAPFTIPPGTGVVATVSAGNINQRWNLSYAWDEI